MGSFSHSLFRDPIRGSLLLALAPFVFLASASPLRAYDVNDKFSVSGIAAATVQCQELDNGSGAPETCEGGYPF